jgi:predicted TIM-barrel fold metal-dependent hydrolase
MSPVDINTFVGAHPHRHVPHPEAGILARVLEREQVGGAWVGYLPSAFSPDVAAENDALFAELAPHSDLLLPAPVVRPDRPGWEAELARCAAIGAPAIRAYPEHWGMLPGDRALTTLGDACAEARLPLMLTVQLEDHARRDWPGAPADLSAAAIAKLLRGARGVRVVVTAAAGPLVEATTAMLSAGERSRLWWDISWIAGPPRDDLARLFASLGANRFLYGSQWPLRLTQTPRANLDLLPEPLRALPLATVEDLDAG